MMKWLDRLLNTSERRIKKAEKKSKNHAQRTEYLLSDETPFDVTEAFRRLKSSLSVSVPKSEGGKVIVATSAYPEDGKTTVAVNLSLMFALSDAKVLLIDADIRKGRVSKYFKEKAEGGLSELLSGQISIDQAVRVSKINKHLSFMTCGAHSPRPYELLESEEMKNLLAELRTRFDYIIIDTPPVLLCSDALALSPVVDGSVLICRHQFSYMNDIERALEALTFSKANVLGVVVNDYHAPASSGYYNRYGYKKYYNYSTYEYDSTTNDKQSE